MAITIFMSIFMSKATRASTASICCKEHRAGFWAPPATTF